MTRAQRRQQASKQSGFAYLFLLFALAVMGLLMAAMGQNWHTSLQREREAELLFIGKQFGLALASYADRTPGGPKAPATLEDLLEDKRFPFPVRHLRQIFRDPITGKRDWDLQLAEGHIVGVRSHSQKLALRVQPPDDVVMPSDAEGAPVYHDWLFIAQQSSPTGPADGSAPLPSPSPGS